MNLLKRFVLLGVLIFLGVGCAQFKKSDSFENKRHPTSTMEPVEPTLVREANVCPVDWGVSIKFSKTHDGNENYSQPSIRVSSNLIKKEDLVGNSFLDFNKNFLRIVDDKAVGYFIEKNGKIEPDVEIGTVVDSVENQEQLCLKIQTNSGITFEEIVKKSSQDCLIFPSWVCGKLKNHYLRIKTGAYPNLVLDSDMSFSR